MAGKFLKKLRITAGCGFYRGMKKFQTIITIFTVCFVSTSFAVDSIRIDGKKFKCKGEITIENSTVVCDGVVMQDLPDQWWISETKTVCGNEQVVTHENGGGMKSVRADVQKGAFLDKESVVCGTSMVRNTSKVLGKSKISGAVFIYGQSEIKDSVLSGSSEVHSSKVINSSMTGASSARSSRISDSQVHGASKVIQGKIRDNTTISGTVEVKNSEIYGSTISGSTFIYDNSLVRNSTLTGSMKIQHGKLTECTLTGAQQYRGQSCTKDKNLF